MNYIFVSTLNTKFCVVKQLSWLCKYTLSCFTVSQASLVLGVLFMLQQQRLTIKLCFFGHVLSLSIYNKNNSVKLALAKSCILKSQPFPYDKYN